MSLYPSGVVFVNDDLTDSVESKLVNQLAIDEVMDGYQFDYQMSLDPEYANNVRNAGRRIMVIRALDQFENRDAADIVLFVKAGLAAMLKNNFGPPDATFCVVNLSWKEFGFHGGNHSIL